MSSVKASALFTFEARVARRDTHYIMTSRPVLFAGWGCGLARVLPANPLQSTSLELIALRQPFGSPHAFHVQGQTSKLNVPLIN